MHDFLMKNDAGFPLMIPLLWNTMTDVRPVSVTISFYTGERKKKNCYLMNFNDTAGTRLFPKIEGCEQKSPCLGSWKDCSTSSASIETLLDPAVSFSRHELQPDKNVSPGRFEPDWNEAKN